MIRIAVTLSGKPGSLIYHPDVETLDWIAVFRATKTSAILIPLRGQPFPGCTPITLTLACGRQIIAHVVKD